MTKKNPSETEIKQISETNINLEDKKQKSRFKGIALLFVLAFGLVIYFIVASSSSWLAAINRFDPINNTNVQVEGNVHKNSEDNITEPKELKNSVAQDKIEGENTANACAIQDEDQLTRFAPEDELEENEEGDNGLSPYDQEAESEMEKDNIGDLILAENFLNNLNDYRIYLANVNSLLMKFGQHKPYTENLELVAQLELPKEVNEVLQLLGKYDKMLNDVDPDYEDIRLMNGKYLDKFLKINKETVKHKEAEKLKGQIEAKLDILVNYMFSTELQTVFLR